MPCHGRAVERRIAKQKSLQEQRPVPALVPRTTIEVAADLGMAAAMDLFCRFRSLNAAIILALHISGSYELTLSIFRWRALALLAYVGLPNWQTCSWGG